MLAPFTRTAPARGGAPEPSISSTFAIIKLEGKLEGKADAGACSFAHPEAKRMMTHTKIVCMAERGIDISGISCTGVNG